MSSISAVSKSVFQKNDTNSEQMKTALEHHIPIMFLTEGKQKQKKDRQ